MMKSKWKKQFWIAFGYCVILVLFLNTKKYLALYQIELRTWLNSSACILLGIFPFAFVLYVLVKLYQSQKAKNPLKTLAIFQGGLVVYCVLVLVATLAVIARTIVGAQQEAIMLDGNYEVRTPYYLQKDAVSYYEPCTPFARKEINMDDMRSANLLELKYQTKFAPRKEKEGTYYISEKYPEIKVTITKYSPLHDTYLSEVTNFLLKKGEETLDVSIKREEEVDENGDITYYYVCDSEEKIENFSAQLAELLVFVLEEPLYQEEIGLVNCRLKKRSNDQDVTLYFGGGMEEVYTEYGQRVKRKERISKEEKAENIASILKKTYQDLTNVSQSLDTSNQAGEEIAAEETVSEQKLDSDEEWLTDIYRLIFEKEFAEKGYSYELERTAKGDIYISLGMGEKEIEGEMVRIRNTLVYDRESKNGLCYLVAFYEEHYDQEGNRQDNTSFLDYYAVVKSTEEVISSGKRGWSDVGNAEFREASGE